MLRRTLCTKLGFNFQLDNSARCFNVTVNSSSNKDKKEGEVIHVPFVFLADHTLTNTELATFQRSLPVDYRKEQFGFEYSDFVSVHWQHRLAFFHRMPALDKNKKAVSTTAEALAVPLEAFLQLLSLRHNDMSGAAAEYEALRQEMLETAEEKKSQQKQQQQQKEEEDVSWQAFVASSSSSSTAATTTLESNNIPASLASANEELFRELSEHSESASSLLTSMRIARGLTSAHLHQAAAAYHAQSLLSSSISSSSSSKNATTPLSRFGDIRVVPSPTCTPKLWRRADVENGGGGPLPVVSNVFTSKAQDLVAEQTSSASSSGNSASDAEFAAALRASLDPQHRDVKIHQVMDTLDKYGFAVVDDPVLSFGIPFPLGVNVADEPTALPSSGLVRELADMHQDATAQRVVWRRNATEFLMRYLFGVVMQSYYGMTPLWGRFEAPESEKKKQEEETAIDGNSIDHLDTAYMSMGIGLHTDATYLCAPPKLQGFGLVHWDDAASHGGANTLADGFAVAEYMSREFPNEFAALCRTPVPCLYAKDGRATAAHRPVFSLAAPGHLAQVSFNAYDRAPSTLFTPSSSSRDIELFYSALSLFSDLCDGSVGPSDFSYTLQPTVGKILIFDNHRCLHARTEFTGPRIMCGSYIGEDDYLSMLNRSRLL